MRKNKKEDYSEFQKKIMRRFCGNAVISAVTVMLLYLLLWKERMENYIVWFLEHVMYLHPEEAFMVYHTYFRSNKEILFAIAIIGIFLFLLWRLFRWMTGYFNEINQGIDSLLKPGREPIRLSSEMCPFERKLNEVKNTLEIRKEEKVLAEKRKDELVMYLAHDIRTPLTSVIGYLNLLEEEPDMPVEERAKNVHITLEKACRLEEMINEFFEITRYNSHQIRLSECSIDLYYMLVQLTDELTPVLKHHGNFVTLEMDEDMVVYADPDKLARVFGNLLKNAAAYSYRGTEIIISAFQTETETKIFIKNRGDTIPAEQLSLVFDKFYRLDQSRSSGTGGTGLGLAIAKDIIELHGGSISASSEADAIVFCIQLPLEKRIN